MFPLSWNAAYERQGLHGKRRIAHQLRFRWGIGLPYTESQPICGNFRAAGRGLFEAEHARWPVGLRGVSFDGDFYAAAFALERGFAGVFHDGNVRRRAFHGNLDQIGFAFAIAIIQPFAAVGEVAGSLQFRFRHCTRLPNVRQISAREPLQVFHVPSAVWAVGWVQAAFLGIAVSRFHFV